MDRTLPQMRPMLTGELIVREPEHNGLRLRGPLKPYRLDHPVTVQGNEVAMVRRTIAALMVNGRRLRILPPEDLP